MTFEKLDDVMKFIDNKSRATVKLYAQKGYINAQKVNAQGEVDPNGRFWNIDNADPTIKKWIAETEQKRKEEAAKPHAPSLLDQTQEQIESLKKQVAELEAKNRELQAIIDKSGKARRSTTSGKTARKPMKKRATPEDDAKLLAAYNAFKEEHPKGTKVEFRKSLGLEIGQSTLNEMLSRASKRVAVAKNSD